MIRFVRKRQQCGNITLSTSMTFKEFRWKMKLKTISNLISFRFMWTLPKIICITQSHNWLNVIKFIISFDKKQELLVDILRQLNVISMWINLFVLFSIPYKEQHMSTLLKLRNELQHNQINSLLIKTSIEWRSGQTIGSEVTGSESYQHSCITRKNIFLFHLRI